jgi:hypothetical protein
MSCLVHVLGTKKRSVTIRFVRNHLGDQAVDNIKTGSKEIRHKTIGQI